MENSEDSEDSVEYKEKLEYFLRERQKRVAFRGRVIDTEQMKEFEKKLLKIVEEHKKIEQAGCKCKTLLKCH